MVGKRAIKKKKLNKDKLDNIVRRAQDEMSEREKGYREQSLKIHPWVCGRCGKTFTRENLHLLTVHHIDHNHSNNPPDGSNWENLCIYCHDNEHQKMNEYEAYGHVSVNNSSDAQEPSGHNPFANLKEMMGKGKQDKDQ